MKSEDRTVHGIMTVLDLFYVIKQIEHALT
jgi:hypothetical protein